MSLSVYLVVKGVQNLSRGSGIFIRENGEIKELTREEWDRKFLGRRPVIVETTDDSEEVFWKNITHNLGEMATMAGIYPYLWNPCEKGIKKASQLIEPLEIGLCVLENNPEAFKKLNPKNGWGTYEGLVDFVRAYLNACKEYPDADVRVSR